MAEEFARARDRSRFAWLWHLLGHHSAAGAADVDRELGRPADDARQPGNRALHLLGSADIALLVAVLVSFVTLGKMRGFNRETILEIHQ